MKHEAKAFLDVPAVTSIPGFQKAAEAAGLRSTMEGDDLLLTLQRGTIRMSADAGRTAVDIEAGDPIGLQLLRDMLAERVHGIGLRLNWTTRPGLERPANLSVASVESVDRISPSYIRVTVSGPDLARFSKGGLHFRILLGPNGAPWPGVDEGGVTQWPGGISAWHRPVYTSREIKILDDSGAAKIVFDIFVHEGGRVTEWAEQVAVGHEIAFTGPGGSGLPTAGWIGMVGDETALPVIARVLAGVNPDTIGQAVVFVPERADIQELARPAGVNPRWVLRGGSENPVDALESLELPATDRYVFFASERSETVLARTYLSGRGLTRGEFLAAAYWTRDA